MESRSGSDSKPEVEITSMESSTPSEDVAPTPVAAVPEEMEDKAAPEPAESEDKPVDGMLSISNYKYI